MEIFQVNQKIRLQPLSLPRGRKNQTYLTYIAGKSEKTLTIAMPIYRGRFVPIPLGQELKLWFAGRNAVNIFTSMVVGNVRGLSPLLVVKHPTEIIRCQRRRFVRVELVAPVKVELIGLPGVCYWGYAVDLSGGGVRLVVDRDCAPGTKVELTLQELPLPVTRGLVVRTCPSERGQRLWEWAVEFIGISELERDKIMKYIFARQRELRRMGLL